MRYFPLFIDLKARKVLVVGGGEEALRKVRLLLKTEARIELIARELHPELTDLAVGGNIAWIGRDFFPIHLDGAVCVFVAADEELNQLVSSEAHKRDILVNVVDEADLSSAIVPAIVDRDPLVIAVGTEGAAPILAQGLRSELEADLPPFLGALTKAAGALRERVADHVPAGKSRREFWRKFFFGSIRDAFARGQPDFNREVDAALGAAAKPAPGRVSLVGAGPGDPELLTLKAQRKLREADVIVFDRLIGPQILEYARRDAVRIAVGKEPGKQSTAQEHINSILVREARAGRHVVRLKGGDPYVFGRGGEEQAALNAAGIPVDVVPGITAALGCAAAIGLPLTQRGRNQSITILTGASEDGTPEHDWVALSQKGQAFAVYMGVGTAGHTQVRLLNAGIDPLTPVTIVENGTLENERVFETVIGELRSMIRINAIKGPAMIYVGLTRQKDASVLAFPAKRIAS
jgi:uroporphyrin-III C-methyltransferase / precorrin-2 dehydrogenase / sirohydrochlorin ferrochelatase